MYTYHRRRFACAAFVAISTFAVGASVPSAQSAEVKQVTRSVTVYTLADAPKLAEVVKSICADKSVVLSQKARKACDDNAFPNLSKALAFRNSGIGAEFNTLARQRGG
jgi:hypothetical protein